jgi:hypothetical protein
MSLNGVGALSSYAFQNTFAQTGSASQALTQALTATQSQAADTSALLASVSSFDPLAALSGGSNAQALVSLAYSASAATGNGPEAVQAMLASLGGGASVFTSPSSNLPGSEAALSPDTTQALARYAYDQSRDPASAAREAATAAQQSLLTSALNLLA